MTHNHDNNYLCQFFHEPRADQRAGGVYAFWFLTNSKHTFILCNHFKTFEAISARTGKKSFSGFVVGLYRLQTVTCQLLDLFQDLLENMIICIDLEISTYI